MPADRDTLLRGATVISVDPGIGTIRAADIRISDGKIAEVGRGLSLGDGDLIDASEWIVLPGLINSHLHTWQTALRGFAANWTLLEYFGWIHRGLAKAFTPDDVHIATLVGLVGQLNAGATTVVDWCHNNPTPEHTDAAVDALFESGARTAFFHGSPKPDALPGGRHFSDIPHPRAEIERLLKTRLSSSTGIGTLGMAILGPHYSRPDVAVSDFRMAREFGLVASMHQGGGRPLHFGGWEAIEAEQLLGPHINIVHGNDLDDARLDRFVSHGVTFTVAPENEMTQGHGFPITGKILARSGRLSVGTDLESVVSPDLFSAARMALAAQRALDNAQFRTDRGEIPETATITAATALEWITIEGARMLGLDHRIGSISPGKQADLMMLRSTDLNLIPLLDPVSTVVMNANSGNVDAVMVAGEFVKRDGRLLRADVKSLSSRLQASATRLSAAFNHIRAATPPR
jgi:cytosine/adenosine deaminase-related metal-dependent hydrolase